MLRQWQPTPVLLPGRSHGQRSLVGCSPWGREGSDTTERLHFHLSLSCIGEGNGNPLQCSCLESSRDGGAWWAAIYGVTQSWTWLRWLSSSNNLFFSAKFQDISTEKWSMSLEITYFVQKKKNGRKHSLTKMGWNLVQNAYSKSLFFGFLFFSWMQMYDIPHKW